MILTSPYKSNQRDTAEAPRNSTRTTKSATSAILLLMSHLPKSLLPLVRRHFVPLPFLPARHEFYVVDGVLLINWFRKCMLFKQPLRPLTEIGVRINLCSFPEPLIGNIRKTEIQCDDSQIECRCLMPRIGFKYCLHFCQSHMNQFRCTCGVNLCIFKI